MFNEQQVSVTIDGVFKHFDARGEPGQRFEAYKTAAICVTLSNKVTIELSTG